MLAAVTVTSITSCFLERQRYAGDGNMHSSPRILPLIHYGASNMSDEAALHVRWLRQSWSSCMKRLYRTAPNSRCCTPSFRTFQELPQLPTLRIHAKPFGSSSCNATFSRRYSWMQGCALLQIAAVVTQPGRPRGRGNKQPQPSLVAEKASALGYAQDQILSPVKAKEVQSTPCATNSLFVETDH